MTITRAEKAAYNDYIKEFKSEIDESNRKIKDLGNRKRKMSSISSYYNLEIVLETIKIIMLYINISDVSIEMLHIKNEGFLNNARKEIYKVLQLMEEIVGSSIDHPLKENEEYIKKIDRVNPKQVLNIIQSIHNYVNTLIERFGESSKWKWSFVDIQGRVAVITKNIVNFSDLQKYRDPRTEYYRERQDLLKLCKHSLNEAAKHYRNRYELSSQVPGDIIKSIDLLVFLRRINVLFGESDEAAKLKNTIDALKARMEAEEKKKEKKKKK
ncbi:MAG: hypothetical protein SVZ03_13585 [Spirochaetota bacterium]|nr:hypothetical protein [Spirochaetota bacterium]